MDANNGSIDVGAGRRCGGLWHVPVRKKKKCQQKAPHEEEVSTKGHAHHRLLTLGLAPKLSRCKRE
jgi:hypothetical protein